MAKKTIRITAQPGPQWDFLATEADICIYGGAAGGGKAQPLSEMVLTPFGYRPMGSLTVGSKVMSIKGRPATVIQVHPQGKKPVYRVNFIDGAQVRCTADHLWLASESRKRYKLKHRNGWKIYTTESLISEVAKGKNMLVPLCEPVQFTRGKCGGVIKPYTLGVILGDGSTTGDMITVTGNDPEIFKNVQDEGYRLKEYVAPGEGKAGCYSFQDFSKERRWLSSQNLRCRAEHKHIPDGYKYATINERYKLLQGLMDTDGHADKRGHCEFCTTSLQLAKDVQWIVWSIGGKATITEKEPSCVFPDGTKKKCRTAYLVYIMTRDNSKLFGIERKKQRCDGKHYNGGHGELKRRILSIEPDGEEECQCITIDEPDGLYITKDFVVTHNSYGLLLSALMYKNVPGFNCTIFRRTFKQVFSPGGLWDTAHSIYGAIPNAQMRKVTTSWEFVDNAGEAVSKVTFAHIEGYNNVDDWQGSQLCEICFDELTHFCVHPDTEVLTENGWKKIAQVRTGEKVPSLSTTGKIEIKKVLNTPSFDYDGKMVEVYQKKGISAIMTPNHKIPVWSQSKNKDKPYYRFVTADKLLDRRELVARCGMWEDGQEVERHILSTPSGRGIGRNANISASVKMDDWLELLGWYLSEGSSFLASKTRGGTSPCVSIRQTKECESLKKLMERLPWRCCDDGEGGYKIFSRQLYDELHPLGNLYQKRIPRYVFNLSRRQQEILFNAFTAGDGHSSDNGACQFGLANEGLIDDLNEMAVYLGRIATKGHYKTKNGFDVYTLSVKKKNTCAYGTVNTRAVKEIEYSGKVHCLTIEDNHTFMIRHRGRICWTGNSEQTFFYMLSRNRSTCGVKPFIRATCNPDADSWVAKFIEWWINDETGYPIPERSGVLRWFVRRDGILYWADTREELWKQFNLVTEEEKDEPRSVTFIMSSIYDNKELLKVNPQYLSSLKALPEVERERLLNGNWKIKPSAGMFFKRSQVGEFIQVIPKDVVTWVRCWDLAATEKDDNGDAAYTAGVLIGKRKNGRYIIADVINKQIAASEVRTLIRHTAQLDRAKYRRVRIRLPQDPGQAGKEQAQSYIKWLSGFDVTTVPESGSKESRAEPMAAQWQAGNFDIIIADWNDVYLNQLENFPEGKYKDMVDASANGFAEVELKSQFNIGNLL